MRGHYKRAPEDRLTSLHDDLLISILSFLPIKQRVALSAVCTRFNRLLPCIPRLDTFHLDVGNYSGGSDTHQEITFPRALIHQCHVVFFRDVADLSNHLKQLLVEGLVESGVQDLILESSTGKGWLKLRGRDCGLFDIKSLRSLSLDGIKVSKYSDRRPFSPLGCALLTSFKMEVCVLRQDFLHNLLASCPFLETLQLIFCYGLTHAMGRLSIHSASLKHLVLDCRIPCTDAVDIQGSMLESLVVDVVNDLHIEAPKAQTASFFLAFMPWKDPSVALMKIFRFSFPKGHARLMLNSSTAPKGFTGIDEFICPRHKEDVMIFNLDFNLKDQSSTMILTELLKKCNTCNAKFDIRTDSVHIESTTETARGLKGSELITLRMAMPATKFKAFISNKKKLKKLKRMGLRMLRSRTSTEQFVNILASGESLFRVSSSIANCIEIKF